MSNAGLSKQGQGVSIYSTHTFATVKT